MSSFYPGPIVATSIPDRRPMTRRRARRLHKLGVNVLGLFNGGQTAYILTREYKRRSHLPTPLRHKLRSKRYCPDTKIRS